MWEEEMPMKLWVGNLKRGACCSDRTEENIKMDLTFSTHLTKQRSNLSIQI
jgi:hypothetical protein